MTVISAVSSQGATVKQNAVCAVSRDADTIAESLLRQGDQKAFQLLIDSQQAGFLNRVQVEVISSVFESDYVAIRIVGTLKVFYTYYTNVIGSAELNAQLQAIQTATQKLEALNEDLKAQAREAERQTAIYNEQSGPVISRTEPNSKSASCFPFDRRGAKYEAMIRFLSPDGKF
jgi:hypothetical protein